jgi:hypothetical protein
MVPRGWKMTEATLDKRRATFKVIYDPEVRFERQVRLGVPSEYRPDLGPCLLWTGSKNNNGYGQFRYSERNGYAHRYAWERLNGSIPAHLEIDHLCRVRHCVEITHLELVDGPTNTRRAAEAATHCKRGHVYVQPVAGAGRDRCEICSSAAKKRSSERAAAKTLRATGLPDPRVKHDQRHIEALLAEIRSGLLTIAQAAREVGCNQSYLGRRAWEASTRLVLERDAHRCTFPGCEQRAEQIHHRQPRARGGSASGIRSFGLANLVSLCSEHHAVIESDRALAYTYGWLVHREHDPESVPFLGTHGWVYLLADGSFRRAENGGDAA